MVLERVTCYIAVLEQFAAFLGNLLALLIELAN